MTSEDQPLDEQVFTKPFTKQFDTHSFNLLPILFAHALDRTAYYGVRTLMTLYMIDALQLQDSDAFQYYGYFTMAVYGSAIIGGLLGDFVLGHKKSAVLFGLVGTVGMVMLGAGSLPVFLAGLVLIALGNGSFLTNIMSILGKEYLQRKVLSDSAFTTYYMSANVGAFVATVLISWMGSTFAYWVGFGMAAMAMLGSVLVMHLVVKPTVADVDRAHQVPAVPFSINQVLAIFLAIVGSLLFWALYESSFSGYWELANQLTGPDQLFATPTMLQFVNPIVSLIGALGVLFLRNSKTFTTMIKIGVGMVIFGIASLLMLAPGLSLEGLIAILALQGIGEIFFGPLIAGYIAQRTTSDYMGITLGVFMLSFAASNFVSGVFASAGDSIGLPIGGIGALVVSVLFLGFGIFERLQYRERT